MRHLQNFGLSDSGGYAEYACVPARNLLPKPRHLSNEEAASLPLVLTTTYHALFTRGQLRSGETVLVMGGSSGIGSAAIQLCKASGTRVITTVGGPEKVEPARRLGADVVVQHSIPGWTDKVRRATDKEGVDLVCEHFGGQFLASCIDLLAPGGRLITIGYTVESRVSVDLATMLRKQVTVGTTYMGTKSELVEAMRLLEYARAKPPVWKVFPLAEARAAHELLESRNYFGKIVLNVS